MRERIQKMHIGRLCIMALICLTLSCFTPAEIRAQEILSKQSPGIVALSPAFGLQMGSSFVFGSPIGGFRTHSLAPSLNWTVNRKLGLEIGSFFSLMHAGTGREMFPISPHMAGGESLARFEGTRLWSNTLYARGSYQLSPSLTLTGTGWMENHQFMQMQMNPFAFDAGSRGMMLGFDYQVSGSLRFGAEFGVSRGQSPFNPFGFGPTGANAFHSPFPFHTSPRW